MANDIRPSANGVPLRSPSDAETPPISAEDFHKGFGEDLKRTLDLSTWRVGTDLSHEVDRIEKEVRLAIEREDVLQRTIRDKLLPWLESRHGAPKNAGHHRVRGEDLVAVQRGLLFNGGVEACDGSLRQHDTLPLTIYQIGVSLVSYGGNQGTWCQRLFRRDLRQSIDSPVEEAMRILEGRSSNMHAGLGELVQKTLLDYAERAILLHRSNAVWRMGHGNPVTYELLTGGGNLELMEASINILREMIEQRQKFLFIASQPRELHLLTVGHSLHPWEYAIVTTLDQQLTVWLHQKRFAADAERRLSWDGTMIAPTEWIPRFIREVASKVVVGVFRATPLSPAQLFYAHVDHAQVAAHIAIADSVMQEQRGSPVLLDLARHVGDTVFGESLDGLADAAYAAAGAAWRYRIEM